MNQACCRDLHWRPWALARCGRWRQLRWRMFPPPTEESTCLTPPRGSAADRECVPCGHWMRHHRERGCSVVAGTVDGLGDTPCPCTVSRRIVRNAARCRVCRDVIESKHRHDFRECSCGAIFVDGGTAYVRRGWRGSVGGEAFDELTEYADA